MGRQRVLALAAGMFLLGALIDPVQAQSAAQNIMGANASGATVQPNEVRPGLPTPHKAQTKHHDRKPAVTISERQRNDILSKVKNMRAGRIQTVDFHVAVGSAVPRSDAVYPVPADIVGVAPQLAGLAYLLIADNLIVVDPSTYVIVAVVPA